MLQTSVWEGASAYGLRRECEATVRAFDLLRRCYGEAKRCAPASMFPASEAVFQGSLLEPCHCCPPPDAIYPLFGGLQEERDARSVRSCQGWDGTLQRSLALKRWEAKQGIQYPRSILPPATVSVRPGPKCS